MTSALLIPASKATDLNTQNNDDGEMIRADIDWGGLKNNNRIQEIEARLCLNKTVEFKSSMVIRAIRRDWNILTSKMYVFALQTSFKKRLMADLSDLHWLADELCDGSEFRLFSKLDTQWLEPVSLDLRLVSPQAASLLRFFERLDHCDTYFITAQKQGVITREQRFKYLEPAVTGYVALKYAGMKIAPIQKDPSK